MHRKIYSLADSTPLRYLVVDPEERAGVGAHLGVDKKLLRDLEALLLPHNDYFAKIKRSFHLARGVPSASVVLEWHEGVNEVSAVIDHDPAPSRSVRAVVFHKAREGHPAYLHPLSPLYEPLSYPLLYPCGGRGWSTDLLNAAGRKLSQMWWYRQQMLRLEHFHFCGRLLNEWLLNMHSGHKNTPNLPNSVLRVLSSA